VTDAISASSNLIHLIILVDSSHDAEVLAITFRNAGYAVRPQHIEDEEDLLTALQEKGWDLMIAAPQVGDYTATQAMEAIANAGKDIPCIVFGDNPDKQAVLELMHAGATHCVAAQDQELFLLVIEREFSHLRDRRAHRDCRSLLAESEKRNRALLDSSRDPIAYIHEGMHIYANLSYLEIFGYDEIDEVESIPIMDMIATEDQQDFKELLRTLSKGETPKEQFSFNGQRTDGELFSASMSFSPATIEGELCTQVVIHQQSDNKELQQELDQLRKQDLLTGLFNRQHFMDELNNAVTAASRGDSNSALLYMEPDNFKSIKDTLGIAGSDLVLSDIAVVLKEHTSSDSILARFAGTIFTGIFRYNSIKQIEAIAEKIRALFEQHIFDVEGKTVTTTFSIGITPITETTPDAKKLVMQAEGACATAKNNKGNSIHMHTVADQLATLEEEKAWTERIRIALKNNQFVLHYQPIVSLHAEPGERYEVLVRMLDTEGNIIMPNDFLPAAENAQLMGEIDKWVMKNTAKAALEKRRDGQQVQFFVKLSNESIEDITMLSWISKLLKAARLHGNSFVFEVSEHTVLNNLKTTKNLAHGLQQLHCMLAFSHVGNDSGLLKHIASFGLSYIKIEGALIESLTSSDASQERVKSITEVSRDNGIQTIAEHVQDPTCLAVLWQHGVNFIQGRYLQNPEDKMAYDFTSEQ